jgi:hypothetical protein
MFNINPESSIMNTFNEAVREMEDNNLTVRDMRASVSPGRYTELIDFLTQNYPSVTDFQGPTLTQYVRIFTALGEITIFPDIAVSNETVMLYYEPENTRYSFWGSQLQPEVQPVAPPQHNTEPKGIEWRIMPTQIRRGASFNFGRFTVELDAVEMESMPTYGNTSNPTEICTKVIFAHIPHKKFTFNYDDGIMLDRNLQPINAWSPNGESL